MVSAEYCYFMEVLFPTYHISSSSCRHYPTRGSVRLHISPTLRSCRNVTLRHPTPHICSVPAHKTSASGVRIQNGYVALYFVRYAHQSGKTYELTYKIRKECPNPWPDQCRLQEFELVLQCRWRSGYSFVVIFHSCDRMHEGKDK